MKLAHALAPFTGILRRPAMRRRNAHALDATADGGLNRGEWMVLGGLEQWVTIRGTNDANPLLLVVHGGPASPYTPFNPQLASWERLFTVVQWDQRGAGKTYLRGEQPELSVDLIVSDGLELTRRLRADFPDRPVILLSSSVGTVIAWKMAQVAPELFDGFVGANQVGIESRAASWRETRAAFALSGNRKRIAALDSIGADPSTWTPEQAEQVSKHAIAASPDVPDMVFDIMLPALMYAPEYSVSDIHDINVAMSAARDALHAELLDPGLTGPMLLPVLLVHGAADLVNPLSAVEALIPLIEAPRCELVVVPEAGHLVEFADVDGFARILDEHVLTGLGGRLSRADLDGLAAPRAPHPVEEEAESAAAKLSAPVPDNRLLAHRGEQRNQLIGAQVRADEVTVASPFEQHIDGRSQA